MNICKNCKHFYRVNGNDFRPGATEIWYNQFCVAVENERSVDPQLGNPCFVKINSLGAKVFTDQRYPYAREINPDGNCPLYEEK